MARTAVRVTPQQGTEKWVQRITAATQQIKAGIERVQTAPGTLAAAKAAKWQQAVTESAPKWRRNVARVSLDDWKAAAINVGVPRIAQGAQAKQNKVAAFQSEYFPYLEQGMRAVAAMPDTTLQDRLQRMMAMAEHNAKFKRGAGAGGVGVGG